MPTAKHNYMKPQGREAWIKEAMTKGMTRQEADDTMAAMVANRKRNYAEAAKQRKVAKPAIETSSVAKSVTLVPSKSTVTESLIRQLPLWHDAQRGAPNEILRSALFNARNTKTARVMLKDEVIASIGEGVISYRGEELRQTDQAVWLQLIHLAQNRPVEEMIEFTPYAFCKAINWSVNGQAYDRLRECIARMQATGLRVYSKRLGKGVSLSMIPLFEYEDPSSKQKLARWRVRLPIELIELFGGECYTRLEWAQRLSLPNGLGSWLHSYLATHRTPHPILLETIKSGAGLTCQNRELRRLVEGALNDLKKCGFLKEYSIEDQTVKFVRAKL